MSFNYTVKEGDTLPKIASKLKTNVDTLVLDNGIKNRDFVQVGQVLTTEIGDDDTGQKDLYESADAAASAVTDSVNEESSVTTETEERSGFEAELVKARSLLGPIQGPRQEGQFIEDEEGGSVAESYRLKYTMKDGSGKEVVENFLTGGVGHRMTEKEAKAYPEGTEIPKKVRDEWFRVDLAEAEADADTLIPEDAPPEVREIITNMAFNLGRTKLREFKDMLKAIKNKDYKTASLEMMDSNWSAQVGDRAVNLAERMRNVQK